MNSPEKLNVPNCNVHTPSLSLIPTILQICGNKPFLLLYGIEMCEASTFTSELLVYKFYCQASNADIATISLISSIIGALTNLFWTLFLRKKNTINKKWILMAGFLLKFVSVALVPLLPYHLSTNSDSFLNNPFVYGHSILSTIGGSGYSVVSQSLLADVIDFDYFLWNHRREAIFQGLMKEGIVLSDLTPNIGLILLSSIKNNQLWFTIVNLLSIIPKIIAIYLVYQYPDKKLNLIQKITSLKRASVYNSQFCNCVNDDRVHGQYGKYENNTINQFALLEHDAKDILGYFSSKQLELYLDDSVLALQQMRKDLGLVILAFFALFGFCFFCVRYFSQSIYLSILAGMSVLGLFMGIFLIITIKRLMLYQKLKCIERQMIQQYLDVTVDRFEGKWLQKIDMETIPTVESRDT